MIFKVIIFVAGLAVMVYFALVGLSGDLQSWIGGVGWALLALYTGASFYTQLKYEENIRMLSNLILDLCKSGDVSKLSEASVGLTAMLNEEEEDA